MQKKLLLVGLLLIVVLFSTHSDLKIDSSDKTYAKNISTFIQTNGQGDIFYQKQCGYCHEKKELIGPDMNKIKAFYLKKYPKKEDFVNAIITFVSNPSKKTAIYLQDKDFMMMPKMPFKKEQIKLAATYIFNAKSFK